MIEMCIHATGCPTCGPVDTLLATTSGHMSALLAVRQTFLLFQIILHDAMPRMIKYRLNPTHRSLGSACAYGKAALVFRRLFFSNCDAHCVDVSAQLSFALIACSPQCGAAFDEERSQLAASDPTYDPTLPYQEPFQDGPTHLVESYGHQQLQTRRRATERTLLFPASSISTNPNRSGAV